jgi:hypothetical protein
MIVQIGALGSSLVDYTEYLFESNEIVLAQERERGAFERTADDVRLMFSNMDLTFTNLFANQPSTSRFRVHIVEENRVLFRGEIEWSSIEFDVVEETVSMNVYSLEKRFWELAKITKCYIPRLRNAISPRGSIVSLTGYTDVNTVLMYEVQRTPFSDLFSSMNIAALYSSRPIRNFVDAHTATDTTIGNDGRLKELPEETTVAELLEAFARYYNAEFFIDAETGVFNMQRRNIILNDINTDITNIVLEDASFTLGTVDEEKYDYIQISAKIPKPYAPSGVTPFGGGAISNPIVGIYHRWACTWVYLTSDGIELETELSDSYLSVPTTNYTGYTYNVYVPIGTAGVVKRNIYRARTSVDGSLLTNYFKVGNINDNITTLFYDTNEPSNYVYAKPPLNSPSTWFGYNELTNSWTTIQDDGTQEQPSGKIFDATPKLEFMAINNPNENLGVNLSHIADFFGGKNDFNLQNFRDQWKDMMIARKPMFVTVEKLNYRIGDSVVNNNGYHGSEILGTHKFLVKKASGNLNQETTVLELVTL